MKEIIFSLLLILLFACQSNSPYGISKQITENNLVQRYIQGSEFELMYLSNNHNGRILHLYIEGDGLPWRNKTTVSSNPTPLNPLALSLMTQDSSPAIYLGRPCYFNIRIDPSCSQRLWTSARYGEEVVASMADAIEQIIKLEQFDEVVLIGHSGGGVLASLIAERIKKVKLYVTIAANLDIKRWTDLHRYSPLLESINPSELNQSGYKRGLHFVGALDQVVPPNISESFILRTSGTQVLLQSYDHICCWSKNWKIHLKTINSFQNKLNQ